MLPGGDHNRIEAGLRAECKHDGRKLDCLWSGTEHDQHLETPARCRSNARMNERPTLTVVL